MSREPLTSSWDLPVWKQLLIAAIVVGALGVGNWFAGMCGGIACAIFAGIIVQIVRAAYRPLAPEPEDGPPEP